MSGNRDTMAEVGPASRLAIERALMDGGLTLREARLLLAGLHQLTTWSRLGDAVYLDQLVDAARVERRQARRALKSLGAKGALFWVAGRGKRRSWLGLPGADLQRPLIALASPKGDAPIPLGSGSKGDATIPLEGDATIPLQGGRHDPPYQKGPQRVLPGEQPPAPLEEAPPDATSGWGQCRRCLAVGDVWWLGGETLCARHYAEEYAA